MAKRPTKREPAILEAVVLLVRGANDDAIAAKLQRGGTPRDDAGIVIAEAKKRIQLTAHYNRDEQLGLAIRRLGRLVELNLDRPADDDGEESPLERILQQDHGVALRAQVELNKLLRLHEVYSGDSGEPEDGEGSERIDELASVREHLGPLFPDVPDDYPISELARMAANEVARTADGGPD